MQGINKQGTTSSGNMDAFGCRLLLTRSLNQRHAC